MKIPPFVVLLLCTGAVLWADERPTIDDVLGREIFIRDGWAGQSITVQKDDHGYRVVRTFFGSGRPVVMTITYRAVRASDYQVRFSVPRDPSSLDEHSRSGETFILTVLDAHNVQLLLNGVQVVVDFDPAGPR